jgi:hypothetical protein
MVWEVWDMPDPANIVATAIDPAARSTAPRRQNERRVLIIFSFA